MSNHWYDRHGKPCYTVIGKNGKERDTTLADARRLQLVPSVTTILDVLNKPALGDWKVRQGVLAALTLPRLDGEDDERFISRVVNDSRQQAIQAAEEGNRIHAAIEAWFGDKWCIHTKYVEHVGAVDILLRETFPDVSDWIPEASFASPLGYGGKVDLHSPSTGIVVDFKTKDFGPGDKKKLAYDQHYQLAAYQVGLGFLDSEVVRGANIFVSRTHPGHAVIHVWSPEEMADGWDVFSKALACWQAIKGYVPDLEGVEA
jgi:hypothetical protein